MKHQHRQQKSHYDRLEIFIRSKFVYIRNQYFLNNILQTITLNYKSVKEPICLYFPALHADVEEEHNHHHLTIALLLMSMLTTGHIFCY